jgi:hypothetical protein
MVRVLFPVNSSARQSRRPLTVSGACYKEWLILTDVYRGQQGNVEEFLIIKKAKDTSGHRCDQGP